MTEKSDTIPKDVPTSESEEPVKCEQCKMAPNIVKHCYDNGKVYYNLECLCKKTPLSRGSADVHGWETTYFKMEPAKVNKESGWDKGILYT